MRILLLIILAVVPIFGQPPTAIERELLRHLEAVAKYGTYGGEYDDDKSAAANHAIRQMLLRYGARADVLKFAFQKLKKEMFVATSDDGKLRIYSWDMQTGGTMHDYDAVFQFAGKSGKLRTWVPSRDDESAGPFYTAIFQLATPSGPIYLAASTFIGSTSLNGQALTAMRINRERLDTRAKVIRTVSGPTNSVSFAYDFFSVADKKERPILLFEFDKVRKEFRFPIVIEDAETRLGRVTDKFITYRFNGTYFVKVN
jgi:hypothetical protein